MRPRLPDIRFYTTALFSIAMLLYTAFPIGAHAADWVQVGTFVGAKGVSTDEYYAPTTVQSFALGELALVREDRAGQPPAYFQVAIDCHDHEYKFRSVKFTRAPKAAFGPVSGPHRIVEGSDVAALELYLCST